jgi:hypothetical protein
VRVAGRPSWRFSEKADAMQHAALYVRDAAGLDVPGAPDLPPPLAGVVPDRRSTLEPGLRSAAAAQWRRWWRDVLAWTGEEHDPAGHPDLADWAGERERGLHRIGAPPDFDGLRDRPELREAVVALYAEGRDWADEPLRRSRPPEGTACFPYDAIRRCAEDVIADRRVSPEDVSARAFLLAVQGPWWSVVAPGVLLCAQATLDDATATERALWAAFASALER